MITEKKNFNLKDMTTFGISAECSLLIEYTSPETDLPQLMCDGALSGSILPLGGGSNMLFTAPHTDLTVLHCTDQSVTVTPPLPHDKDHVIVETAAGVTLDDLCRMTAEKGLWGMENLSGIPGQIGGAAIQNVGAYGTEFCDILESVKCFSTKTGEFITIPVGECGYGYRDSMFKHLTADDGQLIVTSVRLRLSTVVDPRLGYKALREAVATKLNLPADTPDGVIARELDSHSPLLIRNLVIALRDSKLPDPKKAGSAGSFFKNPVITPAELEDIKKIREKANDGQTGLPEIPFHKLEDGNLKLSAAWLIDKAGCKPLTCGGAALWQSQPLVLVNLTGDATAADILSLENMVIDRVRQQFGVTLVPEVIHI